MSIRASSYALGRVLELFGLALLVPTAVAIGYLDSVWPFLVPLAIALVGGYALERGNRSVGRVGMREVFLIIPLAWLVIAGLGTLPYLLSPDGLHRFADAFLESMAGVTTTNVSVVADPGTLPRSLLFWRQFSQWLGGLGVIVLTLALLPRLRIGGREPRREVQPGEEAEQLSRNVYRIARRFGIFYLALTVIAVAILALFGAFELDEKMGFFDAVGIAMAAVSSGGFSTHAGSLASFSASTQWAVLVVMLLAGANLLLVFGALVRRELRPLLRDAETRLYLLLALAGALAVWVALTSRHGWSGWHSLRQALFQAVSYLTTTGFTTANVATWPVAATAVLVGLLLIGGCAGSLAGSQKVMRALLVGKLLRRELVQVVHPQAVLHIRLNRRPVDELALRSVMVFVLMFFGLLATGTIALSLDAARIDLTLDAFHSIADAAAALANGGPGLGIAGPLGSFAPFSDLSKLILSGLMLLGRLEILPVFVLFTKSYWRA